MAGLIVFFATIATVMVAVFHGEELKEVSVFSLVAATVASAAAGFAFGMVVNGVASRTPDQLTTTSERVDFIHIDDDGTAYAVVNKKSYKLDQTNLTKGSYTATINHNYYSNQQKFWFWKHDSATLYTISEDK